MEEIKEPKEKNKKSFPREALAPILLAAATVLLIIILPILGGGKDSGNEPQKSDVATKSKMFYEYFDTVCYVYDYSGGSEEDFEENCRLVEETLSYYHKLFDIYEEYDGVTNLAILNRLAGDETVSVDPELTEFLSYAISMHALTGGNVNIAMGSVLSIWHEYREAGLAVPDRAQLEAANAHTDIKNLVVDEENNTVKFADTEMKLDVGAIAKGYTAEKCAELLKAHGVTSYVLDFGGNLRAIGTKPNGGTWKTGVQNPDIYSTVPYVYYLNVSDTSVVTSGNYQRFYIVDGKTYHHIIDGDTLFPADYYSSVTVITEHSGFADALSTALFNMTKDEALSLLDTLDGVSVVWVYSDGRVETYGLDG